MMLHCWISGMQLPSLAMLNLNEVLILQRVSHARSSASVGLFAHVKINNVPHVIPNLSKRLLKPFKWFQCNLDQAKCLKVFPCPKICNWKWLFFLVYFKQLIEHFLTNTVEMSGRKFLSLSHSTRICGHLVMFLGWCIRTDKIKQTRASSHKPLNNLGNSLTQVTAKRTRQINEG